MEALMAAFTVNGKQVSVKTEPDATLLWVLRDELKLTGTKYGCGASVSAAEGKRVTTIEGLSPTSSHPLQKAWIDQAVPQCGYCQSGQIMKAAELLATNKSPSRDQIVRHMDGNLCRCGTYNRIIAAIQQAAKEA
jgi:isoquinoline 1-oxidoreductase alpha subunit